MRIAVTRYIGIDMSIETRTMPIFISRISYGGVAQLVEQRTENPCVGGSIPSLATSLRSQRSGERRLSRRSQPKLATVAKADGKLALRDYGLACHIEKRDLEPTINFLFMGKQTKANGRSALRD